MSKFYASKRKAGRGQGKTEGVFSRKFSVQVLFCTVIIICAVVFKGKYPQKNSFAEKSINFILNENTDFKKQMNDFFDFLSEKAKVMSVLKTEEDLDPVKNLKAPVKGTVLKSFGLIKDEKTGEEEFCYGVKVLTKDDEKVFSVYGGTAVEVGFSEKLGNYILIMHSEKIYTLYSNLADVLPKEGDKLKGGQLIGTVASDKEENAPVLYFELREGDSFLNPEKFISFSDEKG